MGLFCDGKRSYDMTQKLIKLFEGKILQIDGHGFFVNHVYPHKFPNFNSPEPLDKHNGECLRKGSSADPDPMSFRNHDEFLNAAHSLIYAVPTGNNLFINLSDYVFSVGCPYDLMQETRYLNKYMRENLG